MAHKRGVYFIIEQPMTSVPCNKLAAISWLMHHSFLETTSRSGAVYLGTDEAIP